MPHLSRSDIERALARLYERERHHHLFLLHGTGDPGPLDVANVGRFDVVPVRSELELRELLPSPTDDASRAVFLVPWVDDVPLDIAGHFALGGRVFRIGREAQLQRLFGVLEVEPELPKSPLADYLLRPENTCRYPVAEGRLTAELMWSAWLRVDLGVPTEGGLALDTLLGWAAVDRSAGRFKEAMQHPRASRVREALLAHLARTLGPAGPLVWAAWERGVGGETLEHAVVLEALAPRTDPVVQLGARTIVRKDLGVSTDADVEPVIRTLAASTALALRYVERASGPVAARALVRAADARLDDAVLAEAAAESTRLPSAWDARLTSLGAALSAAAAGPTPAAVKLARARLAALEAHAFFKDPEQTTTISRGEMALRLLAWLAVRPDQKLEPGLQPYAEVETLGRWYTEEGGFVDRARRAARVTVSSPFEAGVAAVVTAADLARTDLDRRFARALVAWVEAGRPSRHVLPIDEASKRIAARFLADDPERKLLVLLLDGMAWAQAVEILESLGARALPWGPLAWHGSTQGKVGDGPYPVMFANLPTITEVSRAAFFAGKPVALGKDHDPQRDPERWKSNPEIKRLFTELDSPPLLLRGEGHTKFGAASTEALTLVGEAARRVVAIVVNAIDDSLKSNPADRHEWGVDNIASLPSLIDKARESGRAVLLVGDHGHVPVDRMEHKGTPQGGARWRPWRGPDDVVADYEVALPAGPGVWAPKDARGVVLLADDASRYGSSTHAGEHGGATLAEVVTPCVLVGCEDLRSAANPDPGLLVRAPFVPSWWFFEAPEERPEPVAAPEVRATKRPTVAKTQLSLLPSLEPEPMRAPVVVAPERPESAFARSPVLLKLVAKDQREVLVRAVDFLVARNGVATAAQFAQEMDELPRRVGGLVAKLSEHLNLDGYSVLSLDVAAGQVRLDTGKLNMLFEVRS